MTLMTSKELSDYLSGKLKPYTLGRKAKSGEMPARRIGGRWVFVKEEIDVWLDAQRPQPKEAFVSRFQSVRQRLRSLTTEDTFHPAEPLQKRGAS